MKIIWRDIISLASKVKPMWTLILSTFLYVCESWTLTAESKRRIQALEMRCNMRLLNISYTDHVTNEEVRNRIQNAIGVHDDLLTMVKKRKLRWCCHICDPLDGEDNLAGDSERCKKKRTTEEVMGR